MVPEDRCDVTNNTKEWPYLTRCSYNSHWEVANAEEIAEPFVGMKLCGEHKNKLDDVYNVTFKELGS